MYQRSPFVHSGVINRRNMYNSTKIPLEVEVSIVVLCLKIPDKLRTKLNDYIHMYDNLAIGVPTVTSEVLRTH